MSAQQLEVAAELLGPMLGDVVFVGGATIYLWLTDPGAPPARATEDVDVICEVATRPSTTDSASDWGSEGLRRRRTSLSSVDGEAPIPR